VGLKPILRNTTSFSALTLLVGSKTVPEMTYNVFSGTLNPTHFTSLHLRWHFLQQAHLLSVYFLNVERLFLWLLWFYHYNVS